MSLNLRNFTLYIQLYLYNLFLMGCFNHLEPPGPSAHFACFLPINRFRRDVREVMTTSVALVSNSFLLLLVRHLLLLAASVALVSMDGDTIRCAKHPMSCAAALRLFEAAASASAV